MAAPRTRGQGGRRTLAAGPLASSLARDIKLAKNQTPRINPRDRKPGERRPLGGRPTFSIWWVLGTLLLLAVVQAWILAPAGQSIPYSEFKSLMRGGQVAEVTVGDTAITGRLKQPRGEGRSASTQFTSTR